MKVRSNITVQIIVNLMVVWWRSSVAIGKHWCRIETIKFGWGERLSNLGRRGWGNGNWWEKVLNPGDDMGVVNPEPLGQLAASGGKNVIVGRGSVVAKSPPSIADSKTALPTRVKSHQVGVIHYRRDYPFVRTGIGASEMQMGVRPYRLQKGAKLTNRGKKVHFILSQLHR